MWIKIVIGVYVTAITILFMYLNDMMSPKQKNHTIWSYMKNILLNLFITFSSIMALTWFFPRKRMTKLFQQSGGNKVKLVDEIGEQMYTGKAPF